MHVATPASSLVVALLARRLSHFTIDVVVNANFEWWGGGLHTKFSEADAVIVVTEWMLRYISRIFPASIADKTTLARHGVDTNEWKIRNPPTSSSTFRIVTVGRLHSCKGHDDLIKAVNVLTSRGHNLRLTLIGDGPQRQELEALVEQLGISEKVTFTGSVAERVVKEYLEKADVFVGASHEEPLGVVYMEAMALGLPTIGTAAGGVPEIIESEVNGLLVPPRDHKALSEALERIMKEPGLGDRLSVAGRSQIVSRFDSRLGATQVKSAIDNCQR